MILILWLSLFYSINTMAQTALIPSAESIATIRPDSNKRLEIIDRLQNETGTLARQTLDDYSSPTWQKQIQERLARVAKSGNTDDFFSKDELVNYKANKIELEKLERSYAKSTIVQSTAMTGIAAQKITTTIGSLEPRGNEYKSLVNRWSAERENNILYSNWDTPLETKYGDFFSAHTWGEVLTWFHKDDKFRKRWIAEFPESLPQINEMTKIWSWDDTDVSKVSIYNLGEKNEYRVLQRRPVAQSKNRFNAIRTQDWQALSRLEFAPVIEFNRLSHYTKESDALVMHYVPVEKGRSMKPLGTLETVETESGPRTIDRKLFVGAELIRKSKTDEFGQLEKVRTSEVNLSLGPRLLPEHEVLALRKKYPVLMDTVGALGFSVMGGPAHLTGSRVEGGEGQSSKMFATLVDHVKFSQLEGPKKVNQWFDMQKMLFVRAIAGGVGSGGSQAKQNPGTATECNRIINKL